MTDRAVDAFHMNRVMFLLSPEGQVWVHPGPTRDDHQTWAAKLGLDWGRVRDKARGFYWADTDSLYVYTDGSLDETIALFWVWSEKLRLALQLHPRTRVLAGVRPGKPGELWDHVHDLGTFGNLSLAEGAPPESVMNTQTRMTFEDRDTLIRRLYAEQGLAVDDLRGTRQLRDLTAAYVAATGIPVDESLMLRRLTSMRRDGELNDHHHYHQKE